MSVKITLSGFKELEAKLRTMPKEVMAEIDAEVQDSAQLWEDRAKNDAPTDQGLLKGEIRSRKIPGGWEVVSMAEYSPYLEWGTRSKVRVPPSLQAFAAQFRGTGQPGNAKEMIYAWCKRQGIPEERWWIIFLTIMIHGINPQPFFFVQRPVIEKELASALGKIVNTPH
jgi:hypothetical protein